MTNVTFIVNDPTALATYVAGLGTGLVVFDGRPTAGKTYMAREIAHRLRGTAVDGDAFLIRDQGKFIEALRFDELRAALEAATPPVLLSTACGRQVALRLDMPVAPFIWIEHASLIRLDQATRDFHDYDEYADSAEAGPLYREVEAYLTETNARKRSDVVYFNARD